MATGQDVGEGPVDLLSLRGSTTVRASYSQRGDPVTHVEIVIGDVDEPDTGTRITMLAGTPSSGPIRATASAERAVVSGLGLLTTDPAEITLGLGLRAYDLDTAPAPCATDSSGEYPVTYGCPVWVVPVDGTTVTAPVLSDDASTVVVGTDSGTVYAVDEATGAVRWTADVGSAVTADVGIADGTVLVPTAANGVVALPLAGCGAATCGPVWSSAVVGGVAQQPVSAGGAVFVAHDGGVVAAYPTVGCGAAPCAPVWSTDVGEVFDAPMAIGSGHLFVIADSVLHTSRPHERRQVTGSRGFVAQAERDGMMGMRRIVAVVAVVAALASSAGCWWQPGGNANRSGHNGVENAIGLGTAPTLAEAWTAPGVSSTPVVVGRRVFLVQGNITARDVSTGAVLWQTNHPFGDALEGFYDGAEVLAPGGSVRSGYTVLELDPVTGGGRGGGFVMGRLQALRGSTAPDSGRPTSPRHVR